MVKKSILRSKLGDEEILLNLDNNIYYHLNVDGVRAIERLNGQTSPVREGETTKFAAFYAALSEYGILEVADQQNVVPDILETMDIVNPQISVLGDLLSSTMITDSGEGTGTGE